MINANFAHTTKIALPAAVFVDAASYQDCAAERARYEIAITTFAHEASPEGLAEYIATMRRAGIKATKADAREASVSNLTVELRELGYGWDEIQWHAARRGRRNKVSFVSAASLH